MLHARFAFVLSLAAAAGFAPAVYAAIGESYGLTSRSASLGGAMVASPRDGASAYQNPASLSWDAIGRGDEKLSFSWGMIYMTPQFTDISNVVVENGYTSDQVRFDNVDTDYPETFGQSVGFGYMVRKSKLQWGVGMVAYLPLDHLAMLDSGETFVPEYVLHRSRNQKPELDLGLSLKPVRNWSIGAGVHLGAALTANTTIFLQTDQTKTSSMRVSASLKTKAAPFVGTNLELSPSWSMGLVARLPFAQTEKLHINANSRALGPFAALDFTFPALATMYYDPLTVELGTQWDYSPAARVLFQVDYQAWSRFEPPALEITAPETTDCQGGPCGVNFASSKNPVFDYRDILVPRIGHEWDLGRSSFRVGYSYRPTILKNSNPDVGNFLDPSVHRVAVGWGYQFARFLDFDTPCRLDLHAAYHHLVSQRVTKSAGNEIGVTAGGEQKIGAPGYEAGGREIGGGLSLSLSL